MKIRFLFILIALPFLLNAQARLSQDIKGIIYDREKVLDLRVHTHGWAVGFQSAQLKTYYKTVFYNFELGELRHFKENKKSTDFSNPQPTNGFRSYTFGKQNYAFVLRGGMGAKRYFTEKASKKGVAVGVSYSGGVTAALMKPYYVEIGSGRDLTVGYSIKYTPETASNFLDPYKIRGKGPFLKGLNETSIIPGIHGQLGLHLDWGAFDEFLKAMEVGIMLDVFPKKLPIMVSEENRPYFMNLYVSLQLGKRS